jgi:DEAD/DEAH box helicase domain-containing protein
VLLGACASARARAEEFPVVPHRVHLFLRAPTGISVCLDGACPGPEGSRAVWRGLGPAQAADGDRCAYCGSVALTLVRCQECGEWYLRGRQAEGKVSVSRPGEPSALWRAVADGDAPATEVVEPRTGECSGVGGVGTPLRKVWPSQKGANWSCRSCHDNELPRDLTGPDSLVLGIATETLLAELDEHPGPVKALLPARGRRLLAFSDSRQAAARLGPRLALQHEAQLVRRTIYRAMEPLSGARLRRLEQDVEYYEQKLASGEGAGSDLDQARRALLAAHEGRSIDELTRSAGQVPLVLQLLPREAGRRHEASKWGQQSWDEHKAKVQGELPGLLMREFASPQRPDVSLETCGLAAVSYVGLTQLEPPAELLGVLPAAQRGRLCEAGQWSGFLELLCDTLRAQGCVTSGSRDLDERYPFGQFAVGSWCTKRGTGYRLEAFVQTQPRGRRLAFARHLCAVLGLDEGHAPVLLEHAWHQIVPAGVEHGWLVRESRTDWNAAEVEAIQVQLGNLRVQHPRALWRCRTSGTIWSASAWACAPHPASRGTLELCSDADSTLDGDPRYGRARRELKGNGGPLELGLWAEEHSAQLSSQENRRLQALFQKGVRNLLSSTTTMELGIDIGGLSGVVLSNVPPGRANYVQRAGRAGRRSDGTAMVLAFARRTPFDTAVFRDVPWYFERALRKPQILGGRERVVRRHVHAYLLSRFFLRDEPVKKAGAMHAFGRVGRFAGRVEPPDWNGKGDPPVLPAASAGQADGVCAQLTKDAVHPPEELCQAMGTLLADTALSGKPPGELLRYASTQLAERVAVWRKQYDRLGAAWNVAIDSRQVRLARYIRYQMRSLATETVVENLADSGFLPRYGFPVGLLTLHVHESSDEDVEARPEDRLRLERQGILALSEYVPGAVLMAGGRQIRSRGLLKHWTGESLDQEPDLCKTLGTCADEHAFVFFNAGDCPFCGKPAATTRPLLFPRHGFRTAAWERPVFSAKIGEVGETSLVVPTVGKDEAVSSRLLADVAGVQGLSADYIEEGELLGWNPGEHNYGYAICLRCGYAEPERHPGGDGREKLSSSFLHHASLDSEKARWQCWKTTEAPVLRHQLLGARQRTDFLILNLPSSGKAQATTVGHSLRLIGARWLEVDPRELGVLTYPTPAGPKIVLYDNTPGGSGHVLELASRKGGEWFREALDLLIGADAAQHDRTCALACLKCVLSYETSFCANLLDRRAGMDWLRALLDGGPAALPHEKSPPVPSAGERATEAKAGEIKPSNEERLAVAATKRAARDRRAVKKS